MSKQSIAEPNNSMSFKEMLRHSFKIFEMQQQKSTQKQDYSELENILQNKFDELFGSPSDQTFEFPHGSEGVLEECNYLDEVISILKKNSGY